MLGSLPQVVWTPSQDPGPYITAPLVVTRDPETGRRNVGTYRLQMKGPQRLGLYVGGAQHAARHIRQYDAREEDMPVAIAIGVDPTIVLASITKFPYGTDEFASRADCAAKLCRWSAVKPWISRFQPMPRSFWKELSAPVTANRKARSASSPVI